MLEQVTNWLVDPSGLTPHGFCLLWEPWLIWTHALSDVAIGAAYFTIPLALARFAQRRRDLVFRPVFLLFAAFILLCGATHLLGLLTIWVPAYGLEAIVKAVTAVVSLITAAAIWVLMPKAMALPSHSQMQAANDLLRDSAVRIRTKYTHTPLPLHVLDSDGRITAVSDRWLDLLGYRREAVLGQLITQFQEIEPAAALHERDRLFAAGERLDVPQRYVRQDGTVLDVLGFARLEHDTDGGIRILGGMADVTALVHAETALRESEQRARLALAAVKNSGTWAWDTANNLVYADAQLARIFGLDPRQAEAGIPLAAYLANVPSQCRAQMILDYQHMIWTEGDHSLVHSVTQADKSVRWFLAQSHCTLASDGSPFRIQGVLIDITDQRMLEDQLRQSQKMEAVGQLTGGLAHDFNNMLQAITGNLELLQIHARRGQFANADRYIASAQDAASRAASLTQRLLAFSRRQILAPEPVASDSLIAMMAELIQRTVGPGITVRAVPTEGLWPTLCDPSQMENALLNLCINARDAMPDGGDLTIGTANTVLDERLARAYEMAPGAYVAVCVTDTGTGMPPDVIARAFDPFFTTKPLGLGTGLGLSMIHGFANQSGGQVRIHSKVGSGTTVRIFLPRYLGEADDKHGSVTTDDPPRAGAGETVLVVDDEPTVRMLVADVLQGHGYTTIEAEDGASGLRILQSGQRIDLLVSDVGLPGGMNGRQMADAARVSRPDLKVLFITGYAASAVFGDGRLAHGMQVITKPFVMDALASKVKAMVEA